MMNVQLHLPELSEGQQSSSNFDTFHMHRTQLWWITFLEDPF